MKEFDFSKVNDPMFGIYNMFCRLNQIKPGRSESLQLFNKVYEELGGVA